MEHKVETLPEKTSSICCHYWLIESPTGPTSRGVCKLCGATKEFKNYGPDLWWQDDNFTLFRLPDLLKIEPDEEPDDS